MLLITEAGLGKSMMVAIVFSRVLEHCLLTSARNQSSHSSRHKHRGVKLSSPALSSVRSTVEYMDKHHLGKLLGWLCSVELSSTRSASPAWHRSKKRRKGAIARYTVRGLLRMDMSTERIMRSGDSSSSDVK